MHDQACESRSEINRARRVMYKFLALAFTDPRAIRWQLLLDPTLLAEAVAATNVLRSTASLRACDPAPGELPPDQLNLHPVIQHLADPALDAEAEFQQTFGLMMSKKHPPYESEYCPQTFSVYRAQVIADVAGFYRAFGLEPSRDTPERHDHIALELEFMAWLIFKEERARELEGTQEQEHAQISAAAARRFFHQHVAWWMPAFAHALKRGALSNFYQTLADVLCAFVCVERALLNLPAPTELVAPQPTEDTDGECEQSCAIGSCAP